MHRHNRHYTEDERIAIRSDIGYVPVRKLARRLGRTTEAIRECAAKENLYPESIAKRSAGLSFSDVCTFLGIDKRSLWRWVNRGQIRAQRVEAGLRHVYTFTYDDVETFLREGGALLTMHPVPGWRELYDEARAALQNRLISRQEMLDALWIVDSHLTDTDHGWYLKGFPRGVTVGARTVKYYDRQAVAAWMQAHRPRYWTARAAAKIVGKDAIREELGL